MQLLEASVAAEGKRTLLDPASQDEDLSERCFTKFENKPDKLGNGQDAESRQKGGLVEQGTSRPHRAALSTGWSYISLMP